MKTGTLLVECLLLLVATVVCAGRRQISKNTPKQAYTPKDNPQLKGFTKEQADAIIAAFSDIASGAPHPYDAVVVQKLNQRLKHLNGSWEYNTIIGSQVTNVSLDTSDYGCNTLVYSTAVGGSEVTLTIVATPNYVQAKIPKTVSTHADVELRDLPEGVYNLTVLGYSKHEVEGTIKGLRLMVAAFGGSAASAFQATETWLIFKLWHEQLSSVNIIATAAQPLISAGYTSNVFFLSYFDATIGAFIQTSEYAI